MSLAIDAGSFNTVSIFPLTAADPALERLVFDDVDKPKGVINSVGFR